MDDRTVLNMEVGDNAKSGLNALCLTDAKNVVSDV